MHMRCCCDTSGPSVQVSPVDQQEHVLRVRRWAPHDWLHALAWAKEGAHPRYGAIWIFCAPHEHPAPNAPPGRKDIVSSSSIVCMGVNRYAPEAPLALRCSERERRLGGGAGEKTGATPSFKFKHSLLTHDSLGAPAQALEGFSSRLMLLPKRPYLRAQHRRRCARPTACSFSVGEACMARVWCRGESAWEARSMSGRTIASSAWRASRGCH